MFFNLIKLYMQVSFSLAHYHIYFVFMFIITMIMGRNRFPQRNSTPIPVSFPITLLWIIDKHSPNLETHELLTECKDTLSMWYLQVAVEQMWLVKSDTQLKRKIHTRVGRQDANHDVRYLIHFILLNRCWNDNILGMLL